MRIPLPPPCYHPRRARWPFGRARPWRALAAAIALAGPIGSAEAHPIASAWVRADPRDPADREALAALAGVGPGEGIRTDSGAVWTEVVLEPWALDALGARFEVRGYVEDGRRDVPDGYRPPEVVDADVATLAARAARGGSYVAGVSTAGRPLAGLWLGAPPGSGAPSVRLLGGHHGDEPVSVEVALDVAERLVDGDGVDPTITEWLDATTVWIVPDVNPDGLAASTRTNARGVDLNRNYDFEWSASSVRPGAHPFSEPETRAVRALTAVDRPWISLTLHAGAENIGWPWNFTLDDPEDAALFEDLSESYAGKCAAPDFWITQGADWYPTRGDTNDWVYGRFGGLDLTVELSIDKAPPAEWIAAVSTWHADAIAGFLQTSPTLAGRVVDAATGVPIEATITTPWGRDRVSDPVTGTFYDLAPDGDATITVIAPGYAAWTGDVEVGAGLPLVDIALTPQSVEPPRTSPRIISVPTLVHLDDPPEDGAIVLSQIGADPRQVVLRDGAVFLDPAAVGGGSWTWTLPDGTVWPHAVFVGDPDGLVVEDHEIDADGHLVVDAAPLLAGARAWVAAGPWRALVEVPAEVDVDGGTIDVDLDGWDDDGPVDVVIANGAARIGLEDVFGAPGDAPRRCGCDGGGGAWAGAWGFATLALRRRRNRSGRAAVER